MARKRRRQTKRQMSRAATTRRKAARVKRRRPRAAAVKARIARRRPVRARSTRKSRVSRPKAKARRVAAHRRTRPARRQRTQPKVRRAARRPATTARQSRQPRTPAIPADILAAGNMRSTATPTIGRSRRTLASIEQGGPAPVWRDDNDRMMAAARSGHDEFVSELHQHTEASPALTAGDVDARWQDAYAVGDEAPGGDNPTPDQDRVDDIGRALGIEYRDDQELQGGEEVTKRDRRRWELDPASSEEWPRKER